MGSSALSGRHLALVGMMGSGKTTVGRLAAERLGRPFFDSDQTIEERTGRTVAQIFADDGEPAFRALEAAVLAEALANAAPSVIAAAGGVVLDPANRHRLRDAAWVVWLRADPAILADRVTKSDHRPLLAEDPEGTLLRLNREREPLYREVADRVVDLDHLKPAEVVERALKGLQT
jgi:shikimate kinase